MLNKKYDAIDDLRGNVRSTGGWRRGLNLKFNDPRNGRSAVLCETLSGQLKHLTDEQFAEIKPYYGSRAWSGAVSQVCGQIGFKHVDSVPAFIARLAATLSQSAVAQ